MAVEVIENDLELRIGSVTSSHDSIREEVTASKNTIKIASNVMHSLFFLPR